MIIMPVGHFAPHYANAVNFDGTNDFLTRGADFTGAADNKLLTFSFWIKVGADGTLMRIFAGATSVGGSTTGGIRINRSTSNTLQIAASATE